MPGRRPDDHTGGLDGDTHGGTTVIGYVAMMTTQGIESLTPKERACLRLVAPDRKSAVIAATLGIAVPTVETHIRSARQKLGGVSRFAAARLLEEHEDRLGAPSQSLTSGRLTIGDFDDAGHSDADGPVIVTGPEPLMLHDLRVPFEHFDYGAQPSRLPRPRYDLSVINRLALITFCLLALVIAGIAAIPLSDAVQKVARMVMSQRQG